MSIYRGSRDQEGNVCVTVDGQPLPLRLDLYNHSPSGFEWGYAGSGPAQLALAILANALRDDERAVALHQQFKWAVVGSLDLAGWRLESDWVRRWARLVSNLPGDEPQPNRNQ